MTPEQVQISCPDRILNNFIIAGSRLAKECEGLLDILGLFDDTEFNTIVFPDITDSAMKIRSFRDNPRGIFCEVVDYSHTMPGSTVLFALRKSGHVDLMERSQNGSWIFRSGEELARTNPSELIVAKRTVERATGLI